MPAYEITQSVLILAPTSELMIEHAASSKITLNNNLLHKDINYIILENGMVQFDILLEESDSLVVERTTKSSFPLISKNNSRTLFRLFSTSESLLKNSSYKIILKIKDQEFTNSFSSKLSPFYLSNPILTVNNDIGELSKNFTSAEIIFAIHMASKDFDQKLVLADYTGTLGDSDLLIRDTWVRYKAILDLLNSAYLRKVNGAGKQTKKVGNLEITKEHNIPYFSDMMKRIQKLFDEVDGKLNLSVLGTSTFNSFTKGGSTSYPLDTRVW